MASILQNRVLTVLMFLTLLVSFKKTNAAVHNIVWTLNANVDYKTWALAKTFQLGDIIVFTYNPKVHNVMRVTHAEYRACNVSSPMSTYTTGNDSIIIDSRGHHFFVCSAPGHCEAGQKVDINVIRAPLVGPGPSGSVPSSVAMDGAPAPSPSGAAPSVVFKKFGSIALLLQLLVLFGLP